MDIRIKREEYMIFFQELVESWDETMINDYLKANGLPRLNRPKDEIILKIIDHEYAYIEQANSSDIEDQYAIWLQL